MHLFLYFSRKPGLLVYRFYVILLFFAKHLIILINPSLGQKIGILSVPRAPRMCPKRSRRHSMGGQRHLFLRYKKAQKTLLQLFCVGLMQ